MKFIRRWLVRLSGGRPMRNEGPAFTDKNGRQVFYFRDLDKGRLFLAEGAWSRFRVWVPYRHDVIKEFLP